MPRRGVSRGSRRLRPRAVGAGVATTEAGRPAQGAVATGGSLWSESEGRALAHRPGAHAGTAGYTGICGVPSELRGAQQFAHAAAVCSRFFPTTGALGSGEFRPWVTRPDGLV